MKIKKYIWGGNDEDPSGLDAVLGAYQQHIEQQYQPQQQQYYSNTQDNQSDLEDRADTQDSNYEDLLAKYQELEDRINSRESDLPTQPDIASNYNDSFLNFLFSDNGNNDPVDWGNIGGISTVGSGIKTNNSGFKQYGSYQQGKQALIHQLQLYQTGQTKTGVKPTFTLRQAMNVYAPAKDRNDPDHYAKFIAQKLGISPNTPISQIDTNKWADAVEQMEGNTSGNNPGNLRRQTGGFSLRSMPLDYKPQRPINLNLPKTTNKDPLIDSYLENNFPETYAGAYANIPKTPLSLGINATGTFGQNTLDINPYISAEFDKGKNSFEADYFPGYIGASYTRHFQMGGKPQQDSLLLNTATINSQKYFNDVTQPKLQVNPNDKEAMKDWYNFLSKVDNYISPAYNRLTKLNGEEPIKHAGTIDFPYKDWEGNTMNIYNYPAPVKRQTGGTDYWNTDKTAYADSVLNANKDLNFVQRYLHPKDYPIINNPDGSYSTHLMADSDTFAYPTIIQDKNGKLIKMSPEDAYRYAMKNKQYIDLKNEDKAQWFSNNGYKLGKQYQFGGKYKVARTPQEQQTGLNDNRYNQMSFPTKGINPYRGLDSHQPVYMLDSKGNSAILTHPSQIAMMHGNVIEKRL